MVSAGRLAYPIPAPASTVSALASSSAMNATVPSSPRLAVLGEPGTAQTRLSGGPAGVEDEVGRLASSMLGGAGIRSRVRRDTFGWAVVGVCGGDRCGVADGGAF
jgi:hypothetical protein